MGAAPKVVMAPEILVLIASSASIAFVHTLLGPDHYVPFVAMARARNWALAKTIRVVMLCGAGHLVGSVALGAIGILAGIELSQLEWVEAARGEVAAWGLCLVGAVYLIWGLRHAYNNRPRASTGWHSHDGSTHFHEHLHAGNPTRHQVEAPSSGSLAPWAIFVVFVLGPCEPLIPLLMFPAAIQSTAGVFWVTGVFSIVTVMTMLGAVVLGQLGLERFYFPSLSRWGHSTAGATMLGCGVAIGWMGL